MNESHSIGSDTETQMQKVCGLSINLRNRTIYGDGSQYDPRWPFGQVFDEDEGHEGADDDEVRLLQPQRPFPVDADHSHNAEIPDDHH